CSKRRSKAPPKTVNQIVKSLKSRARRINQRFFDPSRWKLPIFEKLYGNKVIINHHNISVDKDFYALTRAVDRFRCVLKSSKPKLFVHVVSSDHIYSSEYRKLWESLKTKTDSARFLLIGLNKPKEKSQLNEIHTHEKHFRIVEFTPTSEIKEGICFSDPSDNILLRQVFDAYKYDLTSRNQRSNDSDTMKENKKTSSVVEIPTSLEVSEKFSINLLSAEAFEPRPDPDFLYGYIPSKQINHFRNDQYIPPVRILTISDVRLIGPFFQIGVLLEAMGNFFNIPDIASNPTTESSQNRLQEIEKKLKERIISIRKIRGKAILIACNGHQIYGHWLIDFLPKLALLAHSGYNIENIKLLVPENMGEFGKNLLKVLRFYDDQFISYNPETEILDIDELVIPSTLRWGGRCVPFFTAAATWINERINEFSSLPETNFSSRIFISRSMGGKHGRTLINEKNLIEMAENYGFQAVAPELLTLPEQISMFRKATHIVGPYGSGLHGSIFSPPKTTVCGIHGDGAFDALQSGVGERLQQKTGYIFTETQKGFNNHRKTEDFSDIFLKFLNENCRHPRNS
ncbi:DUF563 domain-containing protein, partial [Acetobacter estunensis]